MSFIDFLIESFRRLGFLVSGLVVAVFGFIIAIAGLSGSGVIFTIYLVIGLIIAFVGLAMIAYSRR